MFAEKPLSMLLQSLSQLEYGTLRLELPNGQSYEFQGDKPGPKADLRLHDKRVITNMALRGDIAFAEDYRLGKWESTDLAGLVEWALRNDALLNRYISGSKILSLFARFAYLFRQNTKTGSRKNIHAHYDLGNSFYALWLDPTMTYSSAIFEKDEDDLLTGQYRKYDRILGRIGHQRQQILEIGCGWGGFAERGLAMADHDIRGITISPSQCAYAKERLQDMPAQIELQDYRDVRGKYDAIVSIEMFEAVGERYWKTYFEKIASLLNHKGKAVIQAITIDDRYFEAYRRSGDSLRSYIFPGGMLPSPKRFREEAALAGLQITDHYAFGQDYARTLTHWLKTFEAKSDAIRAQNFDESFMRLWRFYLSACIGGFRAERTNVMQVELRHG